ncbi:RICIN domain-containing protein [Streptomyces litchfieldiae]|uniref:XRE family transcriptional regulator n=1 Tax=Streptomyces litchfieldiae TaxID=3075543 RepID=A0ABU2MX90_9ACTN|nr:XRE family transcriptional regulator [Streptomyces sp. DSM 44938]MDT0345174.1 XRE family transcriptional regulator [Streptomyces sp. DSM 44938]
MEGARDIRPEEAAGAAEFVALMQRLKDRSGLSYRQLEEAAESRGEVLARSTVADVLRRSALPRPELLAAFVRACGDGDRVDAWLAARDAIAAAGPAAEPGGGDERPGAVARWWRRPARLAAVLAAALLMLAGGAWVLLGSDSSDPPDDAPPGAVSLPEVDPEDAPATGLSRIHPAGAAELCVTEGRERTGQYHAAIAAQGVCDDSRPPYTHLEPAGDGFHHIQWDHPAEGLACLTVLTADTPAIEDMLEPWNDCAAGGDRQRFLFEPVGESGEGRYRIRTVADGDCLGVAEDGGTRQGLEVMRQPCEDGAAHQEFLVEPVT